MEPYSISTIAPMGAANSSPVAMFIVPLFLTIRWLPGTKSIFALLRVPPSTISVPFSHTRIFASPANVVVPVMVRVPFSTMPIRLVVVLSMLSVTAVLIVMPSGKVARCPMVLHV